MQAHNVPRRTIKAHSGQINAIFGGIFAYCSYMHILPYNIPIFPYIAAKTHKGTFICFLLYISVYGQKYAFCYIYNVRAYFCAY